MTDYIAQLKSAMTEVKSTWPFIIKAMVVLPDHLHVIWQLPQDDNDYSIRWLLIKRKFTQLLKQKGVKINKNRQGICDLWQRRFWEHVIRDDRDYENHVNYIHYNPVKHRYVKQVKDWPYSTFHDFVRKRFLGEDWGCGESSLITSAKTHVCSQSSYGERIK